MDRPRHRHCLAVERPLVVEAVAVLERTLALAFVADEVAVAIDDDATFHRRQRRLTNHPIADLSRKYSLASYFSSFLDN
jgi:hypothetical protein